MSGQLSSRVIDMPVMTLGDSMKDAGTFSEWVQRFPARVAVRRTASTGV